MSENIYTLLNRVMEDVGAVSKKERNQQQNFNFRGIDAVVNAVSPAFRKHGIVAVPEVINHLYSSVEVGQRRTPMGHCQVTVCYRFYAPDGSHVSATVQAESMDSGDKATAKAMSVAFRTALLQTLCLPTDEQDPDHDVYERSPAYREPAPAPKELSVEDRYEKFKQLCATEGFPVETILGMAGISEPITEDDLPQLRETFKAYKMQVQRREGVEEDTVDGRAELAQAVQTVKKAFEMPKSDLEPENRRPSANRPASEPQVKKLHIMYKQKGIAQDDRLSHASRTLGVNIGSFGELTSKQASRLIDELGN